MSPLLVASGHHVIATSRMPSKLDWLRAQGADPVIVDRLDKDAVMKAIDSSKPDVIVHQTTAIASTLNLKRFDCEFAVTNRLRTEGTEYSPRHDRQAHIVSLSRATLDGRTSAKAVASRLKSMRSIQNPPKAMTKSLEAIRMLESMVLKAQDVGESCSAMTAS